ncbi:MAG: hypothetical protein H5T86_06330, partial [Armatimonadetes bacterium]|nr:hypothetical protein [Armatimonadota bacterium]
MISAAIVMCLLTQPAPVCWDFEDGTLQGWTVVSGNLAPQPTDQQNDRHGDAFGKQGQWFIGTCELPGPGPEFDDRLTGEIRSPVFTIHYDAIALLVGGGANIEQTFVALVDASSGTELRRATGNNAEYMEEIVWDLRDLKGRAVYLRIVDEAQGGWGHINVDFIRELTPADLEARQRDEERRQAQLQRAIAELFPRLWERDARIYQGDRLAKVALPIGGIGTGSVYVCGNGDLTGWQIFNEVSLRAELPHSFFAIRAKPRQGSVQTRVLQTTPVGTWRPMAAASFRGEYPLALVGLSDPDLPVAVGIEAFSPMVPGDARHSAIPAIIFVVRLINLSDQTVDVALLASLTNAVGWDGHSAVEGVVNSGFAGNTARAAVFGSGARGLLMEARLAPDSPRYGTLALCALDCDASSEVGYASFAWDDLDVLRASFEQSPTAPAFTPPTMPTPAGRTINGAVVRCLRLAPGERAERAFAICWHFPNRLRNWDGGPRELRVGNMYNNWYRDAAEVAADIAQHYREYRRTTELFHQVLFASSLPRWLAECLSVHIATIRSPLIMWLEDGTVAGFEGLSDEQGCCPMNCTHVYNYAQTMAFLWPEIERAARELDLGLQLTEDGGVRHRLQIPLSLPRASEPFADGQLGTILKAYREVLNCRDLMWLRKWWPSIRKAMDFVLEEWDADENGVIEGPQPNTYDCTVFGANTFIGSLYLAALRAAEEMAIRLGESAVASKYRVRFVVGLKNLDATCWREDLGYYVQVYDAERYRSKQWGIGCLSDQLLGQWWAHVLDLGYILPKDHVREALRSIFRNNFRLGYGMEVYHHRPKGDDGGLLVCTWPHGGRPADPINYADGTFSGVEYQVAAHMVYEGMISHG